MDLRWRRSALRLTVIVSALLAPLAMASEAYRPVPMPPEVRVAATELDGPVFTDSKGHTLYQWPLLQMRNGVTGDHLGTSECNEARTDVSAGLMSPYPGGLRLPDLSEHPSCVKMWPPFIAGAAAKPVGKWTVITRKDGSRQWAYDDLPLYTFYLDKHAGDVLGARSDRPTLDAPAVRRPAGPPPDVPPGFAVKTMSTGRLLVTEQGMSVYYSDSDAHGKSSCDATCAETWIPLLAPNLGRARENRLVRALGVRSVAEDDVVAVSGEPAADRGSNPPAAARHHGQAHRRNPLARPRSTSCRPGSATGP